MPPSPLVLIVDDAFDTREVLRRNLEARGYRTSTADSAEAALRLLQTEPVQLVITDIRMPGPSGLDLLRHIRDNCSGVRVVVITGYPRYDEAIQAMKIGAEEYLIKPFTDEELFTAVEAAFAKQRLVPGPQAAPLPHARYGLIGESPAMKALFATISRAAATDATVLIQGESGTGKELVARAIHYESRRVAAPFVAVNCGAIPETLLESELFGHLKGAFTGAHSTRAGFFQTADSGTILLDEIAEAPSSMQVKLLRVLQDKEIFMLGATRPTRVDVRIMAAANKDLEALTRKGHFREDLFYRLNVIRITVPPLTARGDDIVLLIRHFIQRFAQENGQTAPLISDRALALLRDYHWPGNVRELENIIMRIMAMSPGATIEAPDLPQLMRYTVPAPARPLDRPLREVEAEYIRAVLASVAGNKSEAARILGITRRTLREKLAKAGEAAAG
ncbi:MAG TPA: sigma-54-dependent Fis family transcriptional regulator [Desulfobacteraceae bacterium]|nr:sigma-54-dependent Fis family transcriptional regulator [Desulfobacteraceae bacterium]